MRRIDAPEILDCDACRPDEVQAALRTLSRINRWFGGISTTRDLVRRVAQNARRSSHPRLSLLEVASGTGDVSLIVKKRLGRSGLSVDVTLLDRAASHLAAENSKCSAAGIRAVCADALALPFRDESFDVVSCNLFAHHLAPERFVIFLREGLRVSRTALLINDLIRHPVHLALVYASFPVMGSRVAWLDGLTSVRRAYTPEEMRAMIAGQALVPACGKTEIFRRFLFRMGIIVWKDNLN